MFFASIPKTAYQHPVLRLLPDDDDNKERLNGLRDLDGSNNVGRFKPLATPLMMRLVKVKEKGGRIAEKEAPLMGYIAVGEGKVLATAADTHWRWHLQAEFEDTPLAGILANAIRYLAPPPGQEPGKPSVTIGDGTPQVGQDLIMATDRLPILPSGKGRHIQRNGIIFQRLQCRLDDSGHQPQQSKELIYGHTKPIYENRAKVVGKHPADRATNPEECHQKYGHGIPSRGNQVL